MLENKLKYYKATKELIEVYHDDSDTTQFTVGVVLEVDASFCLMRLVSPSGLDDGLLLIETTSIFSVVSKSKYLKWIGKISDKVLMNYDDFELLSDNFVLSFLEYIKNKHYIAQIYLLDSKYYDVQGFLHSVTNSECTLELIDDYGNRDGECVLLQNTITKIGCHGIQERLLEASLK